MPARKPPAVNKLTGKVLKRHRRIDKKTGKIIRHHRDVSHLPKSQQMERKINMKRHALPMGLSIYEEPDAQGKPEYVPTEGDRRWVRRMAACGLTADDISDCIQARYFKSMSPTTVQRHFGLELKSAKTMKVAYVGNKLFQKIREGNLSAMIFFLKTQGRWSSQVNLGDPNGNPLAAPSVEVMFGAEEEIVKADRKG